MRKITILFLLFFLKSEILGAGTITVEEITPSSTVTEKDEITIKWKSDTAGKFRIEVGGTGSPGTGDPISENYEGNVSANTYVYTRIKPSLDFKEGDGEYTVYIYLTPSGGETINTRILLTLDDIPDTPQNFKATPGNGILFLSWKKHPDRDIERFEIYWRKADSSSPLTSPVLEKGIYPDGISINSGEATSYTLSGLENGTKYYLAIRAVDFNDKVSPLTPEIEGTPRETLGVSDFISEEGGCIITYFNPGGSYEILRMGKKVLTLTETGREFIKWYYGEVFHRVKNLSRVLPKSLMGFLLSILDDRVLLFLFLLPFLGIRKKLFIPLIFLYFLPSAFAESPRNFTLSFSVTNYRPDKLKGDLWPEDKTTSWDAVYGKGGHLRIEGEFGWEFFKLFGVMGISMRGGFFRERGYGLVNENGNISRASRDHEFYIFPLRTSLFYRLEFISDQPLIPYGRGGFDWFFFQEKTVNGKSIDRGVRAGYHWGGGVILVLDFLDKKHATKIDEDFGVNYCGIFVEYIVERVNRKEVPFGNKSLWDFTSRNLYAGIVFDF